MASEGSMGSQRASHTIQSFVPVCPNGDLGTTGAVSSSSSSCYLIGRGTIFGTSQPLANHSRTGTTPQSQKLQWPPIALLLGPVQTQTHESETSHPHSFISGAELAGQPVHNSEVWSKIVPCRSGPADSWGEEGKGKMGTETSNR